VVAVNQAIAALVQDVLTALWAVGRTWYCSCALVCDLIGIVNENA
jgi:hypothetical protein